MERGTPTWSMERLGSAVMTVRAEKSTRLPMRFPRMRPSLPAVAKTQKNVGDTCTSRRERERDIYILFGFERDAGLAWGPLRRWRMVLSGLPERWRSWMPSLAEASLSKSALTCPPTDGIRRSFFRHERTRSARFHSLRSSLDDPECAEEPRDRDDAS